MSLENVKGLLTVNNNIEDLTLCLMKDESPISYSDLLTRFLPNIKRIVIVFHVKKSLSDLVLLGLTKKLDKCLLMCK